jgi:hypothetical protein
VFFDVGQYSAYMNENFWLCCIIPELDGLSVGYITKYYSGIVFAEDFGYAKKMQGLPFVGFSDKSQIEDGDGNNHKCGEYLDAVEKFIQIGHVGFCGIQWQSALSAYKGEYLLSNGTNRLQ